MAHKAKKNRIVMRSVSIGGAGRDRTGYLLHAMEALSQVSYNPIGCKFIVPDFYCISRGIYATIPRSYSALATPSLAQVSAT